MKGQKHLWKFVVLFIIVLLLTAFSLLFSNITGKTIAETDEVIKIGVIGTFTGPGAYFAEQELKGINLARDEINNAGGINGKRVEFIVEDSESAPAKGVSAIQKLINVDKIKFIIGDSWVSTTVAMVPVVNEYRVILVAPLAQLDELSGDDYFFRIIPTTMEMIKPLAEYAYNELGSRKVAIIKSNTPYGFEHARDFKQVFESLGGEITGDEIVELTQKDVRSELTKIKLKNPDTIFNLHTSSIHLGLLMKQAKELGIDVKYIASYGAENNPLIEQYGDIAEGLTYPYPYDENSNDEGVRNFIRSYKNKYNEIPDMTAANSYDALKILAHAIEAVGEDPNKVKEFLTNLKNYNGGSGILSFDKNGDVIKPVFIKKIHNKEFVKIK